MLFPSVLFFVLSSGMAFCPKLDLTWNFTWRRRKKGVGTWRQTHPPGLDRGLRRGSHLGRAWLAFLVIRLSMGDMMTLPSLGGNICSVMEWESHVLEQESPVIVLSVGDWGQGSSSSEGSCNMHELYTYLCVCRFPYRKSYFFPKCGNRCSVLSTKIFLKEQKQNKTKI